jgi:YD repeat-containing protein
MNQTTIDFLARIVAALSLALASMAAFADGVDQAIPSFYQEPGHSRNRDYVNQHANEKIDPFTGKLQWHFTDMFIPGNGGMDLKVQRSYSSLNEILNDGSPVGAGWTMHFGRVLRKWNVNICDFSNSSTSNNRVLELPDGSRHILYYLEDGTAISTGLWQAKCIGNALYVLSPDGTKYEFGAAGQGPLIGTSGATHQATWYVTRITDRNDNYIDVSYNYVGGNFGITSVTTSDGRSLTYSYAGGRLDAISDGSRIWTYVSEPIPGQANHFFLTEVRRPDGATWRYEYNPTASGSGLGTPGGFSMKKVTYPTGGEIQYTYGFVTINALALPVSTVVTQKQAGAAAWTYTYTPATTLIPFSGGVYNFTVDKTGADTKFDKTLVSGPEGNHLYLHVGYGSVEGGSVWLIGSLVGRVSSTLVNGAPEFTEMESNSWEAVFVSPQANLRPGASINFDTSTNAPRLFSRTISRAGRLFTTTYSNFDQYNNAQKIVEEGTHIRTIDPVTYYVDPVKRILHTRKNETVTITGPGFTADAHPIATTREFDAKGNLTEENRNGVLTKYTYDGAGNVQTKEDARQMTTTYLNYTRGIPQQETHPEEISVSRTVSPEGNVMTETDGENTTTRYGYDSLNRLKLIEHATGSPIQIEWTPNTRVLTRGGYTETTTFDGFGREIQVQHSGDGQTITQTYKVDDLGRRIFTSYPNSSVGTGYVHNIVGQPTKITHEHNPSTNTHVAARDFIYNLNTTEIFNERGKKYIHTYREFGDPASAQLMSIAAPLASASVTMQRNGMGQLTSVAQEGKTRTYGYNSRYYRTSMTDPEVGETQYGRDAVGNMTSRKVGASGTSTFAYDGRNRLTFTDYPDINSPDVTRTYYKDDKPKTVSTSSTLREYDYDGSKNLVQERLTITGQQPFVVTYGHDASDALSGMSYSTGQTVSYAPDAFGRPTRAAPYVSAITHHPGGQINTLKYANGVTTTIELNSRQWPSTMGIAGSQPFFNTTYGYDDIGNVLSITDAVDVYFNRGMDYDDIDRVTTATGGHWGSGTITYDGKGNISGQTLGSLGTLNYTYDSGTNRLTSISGRKSYTFSYDAYGNVTGNGASTFTYSDASNMRCANCGQPSEILYDYDGANMRVRSQKGSASTYFMYGQGGQLLWEVAPTGLKEYIYVGGKQIATRQKPAGAGTHVVSVARAGNAATSGSVSAAGINCGDKCMQNFANNTQVSLSASASGGATFAGWSGVACSGGNGGSTCTFTVVAPVTVTATFTKPVNHAVSVARVGNASSAGSVASSPAGISCGVDCTQDYPLGTALTLTANISGGGTFAEWQGVTCSGGNNNPACSFTVSGPVTARAKFTQPSNYVVTVTKAGSEAAVGTVTSSPAGISCGADCTETLAEGTAVTLTASAGTSTFAGWSGVTCTGGNAGASCAFTLSANTTVTATFKRRVAFNDFDGDGYSDILVGASSNPPEYPGAPTGLGAYRMTSAGGNASVQSLSYFGNLSIDEPTIFSATGDFDGDGKFEIVSQRTGDGLVRMYSSNVSGIFNVETSYQNICVQSSCNPIFTTNFELPDWRIMGSGDFNGDGKSDLVWYNPATKQLAITIMNGSTVTQKVDVASPPPIGTLTQRYDLRGIADVDGNGTPDLIFEQYIFYRGPGLQMNRVVMFFSGTTVESVVHYADNYNYFSWIVGVGDLNGDGKADTLRQDLETGDLYAWFAPASGLGNASPNYVAPTLIYSNPNPNYRVVQLGDFDGDGKLDILLRVSSGQNNDPDKGQIYYLKNTTTGTTYSNAIQQLLATNLTDAVVPAVPCQYSINASREETACRVFRVVP